MSDTCVEGWNTEKAQILKRKRKSRRNHLIPLVIWTTAQFILRLLSRKINNGIYFKILSTLCYKLTYFDVTKKITSLGITQWISRRTIHGGPFPFSKNNQHQRMGEEGVRERE